MEDISALVRRVDEDRWLASRFAPARVRARLMALYAVNYEIARGAEVVRTAPLGDIRLAWWREALDEIHDGKAPRAHPALEAYARAHNETPYLRMPWAAMFAARGLDLEPAPFASLAAITRYVDATAGGLMRLAVAACDPAASGHAVAAITPAARAWGLTGLLRAAPIWAAHGRSLLPAGVAEGDVVSAAASAYAEVGRAPLPAGIFPALGYGALVPLYLRALEKPLPLLRRQMRLIGAAASGRL
jgi:phytoene synthase